MGSLTLPVRWWALFTYLVHINVTDMSGCSAVLCLDLILTPDTLITPNFNTISTLSFE